MSAPRTKLHEFIGEKPLRRYEVMTGPDDPRWSVTAHDWEVDEHGYLVFYVDSEVSEVFRQWTHMECENKQEESQEHLQWHSPTVSVLKDAWAEICELLPHAKDVDRPGLQVAADLIADQIQIRTGIDGLVFSAEGDSAAKATAGEAVDGSLSWGEEISFRPPDRGMSAEELGSYPREELFQPGWTKFEFKGGPLHGHEGLLPHDTAALIVRRNSLGTRYERRDSRTLVHFNFICSAA